MAEAQIVPTSSDVYYGAHYWNVFPEVNEYLNERATGDKSMLWSTFLKAYFNGRVFERALVLNCGNGWVERHLVADGFAAEAVGIDWSEELLGQARTAAADAGLAITYERVDTNTAQFPDGPFDLVVNFAAGHHIAYLDRVFRELARLLPADGVFVSWDYVGPHRNQWTPAQWEAMWQANEALPVELRQVLHYPHIPTMMADDPTEAVHSELVLEVMARYFTLLHARMLGGAVAYPIVTMNPPFYDRPYDSVRSALRELLDADAAFTDEDQSGNTLFAYVIAQPNATAFDDAERLGMWERDEIERESGAVQREGRYYAATAVATISEQLGAARAAAGTASVPTTTLIRALAGRVPGAKTLRARLRQVASARRRA